jgi:hypothetical protein
MADIGDWYVIGTKEFFLEREDAQQVVNDTAHLPQPALPPSPDLRRHQVDHRYTGRL